MNKIFIVVILLLLYIDLNFSLNILNSTITKKEINLFGNQLNYAIFEFQLDSDIFKYDSLACPNFTCPLDNNGIDCSCDYTGSICPKVRDSSCTNTCPEFDEFDTSINLCENNIDIGSNWITIVKDKEYTFTSNKSIQLRYKADASICEGVMIQNYPIIGFYKLSMGKSPVYFTQRDMILSNPLVYGVMNMCPSDNIIYLEGESYNQGWTRDTYYFTLQPFTKNENFTMSFKLTSKNVSPPIIPTAETKCTNISNAHQCLNDGELIEKLELSPQAYHYYTFKATKSAIYTIRCPNLRETVLIMADDTQEFPIYSQTSPPKWGSKDSFENNIVLYLEKDKVIFISVFIPWPTFYSFSITSHAYYSPVNISSLPSKAAMFALVKSSRIQNPLTNINCESWSQCYLYTIGAPYTSGDPVSPLSPPYLTHFIQNSIPSFIDLKYDDTLLNPLKPNTYQAAFILSYKIGSATTSSVVDYDLVLNSKIEFLSTFFDKNGQAISNIVEYKEKELECNYKELNEILIEIDRIEQLLYNVTDLKEMNNYRYQLDTLTFRNSYVGCSHQAINLLEKQSVRKNVTGTFCNYDTSDPRFQTDPCCSIVMRYKECCNPISVEVDVIEYIGVVSNEIKDQCSNPDCTETIVSQYYNTLDVQDDCSIENNILDKMKIEIVTILRQCQSELTFPTSCTSDQDCKTISGPFGTCDIFAGKCLPDYEFMDKRYLNCAFSQLDQGVIYKLLKKPFTLNETIIQEIYNRYQKDDCINQGTFASRQVFTYASSFQEVDQYYPSPYCLDDSCPLVHDLNYDDIYGNFIRSNLWPSFDGCELFGICNSNPSCFGFSFDPNLSTCINDCSQLDSFCGYCSNSNSSLCFNFSNEDQSSCQTTSYCIYPNNNYIENITQDQCENNDQSGYCSVPCGYTCEGFLGCAITNVVNETECLSKSSTSWDSTFGVCKNDDALSIDQCIGSSDYEWVDCLSKEFDECVGPNVNSLNSICKLIPVECKTKQECESAGQCSDNYFFSPENTKGYPLNLGKCVRLPQLYRNLFSCFYSEDTTLTEQDSPMGCFNYLPNVFSRQECEELDGYEWWSPSQTQDQCLSYKGCKIYQEDNSKMLPYNTQFNHMDEATCLGCYESNNEWTEKFEWKKGIWNSGVFTMGNWIKSKWISTNQITTTLDYAKIYNDLMNSADSQMSDLLRSEYFCRMFRTKNNLDSISCSCSGDGDGDSECFKDTSLLLGQTKPCHGKSTTFTFDYGQLEFLNSSVEQGCGNVLVSQFPKQNFKSVEKQSFPSGFVSYPIPEEFGVFNENNAIIGLLLGDGIYIESQGVNSFNICLEFEFNDNSEKYTNFDFASQNQQNQKLYPKGLNQVSIIVIGNQNYLCSIIDDIEQNEIFFPINRIENWKEEKKSYFDKSTEGLLYTLAVLFLLVSIYGLYQLIIVSLVRYKRIIIRFELVHLLILMIFIFVTVRMVYFFLLPNGYLANSSIADYSLVVLPTFFYFSCFTIIIVLWYAIVFLVLKNNSANNLSKKVNSMLLMVNILIYLLLIAIIIVFQYTKNENNNSCGNRIIIEVKTSSSQKAVSIVYAVTQAAISLIIASAFIYLGGNLYKAMKKATSNSSDARAIKNTKKIFMLTTICSGGFILHCIFIVILVAIKNPSVVFSFVGLIITEIIPTTTILYCYDQRVGLRLDKTLTSKSSSNSVSDTKLNTMTSTENTFSQNLSSE